MDGHYVERRFGWDCHGLPIEHAIDKQLGIKNRNSIYEMGIDKYNDDDDSTKRKKKLKKKQGSQRKLKDTSDVESSERKSLKKKQNGMNRAMCHAESFERTAGNDFLQDDFGRFTQFTRMMQFTYASQIAIFLKYFLFAFY